MTAEPSQSRRRRIAGAIAQGSPSTSTSTSNHPPTQSGTSQEGSSVPPPSEDLARARPRAASPADLCEVLRDFGVDLDSPDWRLEKARAAAAAGATVRSLTALCRHIESVAAERTPRAIATLLRDPGRLQAALQDHATFQHAKDARGQPYFGEALWTKPDQEDATRPQRVAYARHVADGAAADVVAAEMGITADEVSRLADAERAERARTGIAPRSHEDPQQLAAAAARRREETQQALRQRRSLGRSEAHLRLAETVRRAASLATVLADEVRRTGELDLGPVLRNPVTRGALAILEERGEVALGELLPTGKVQAQIVPQAARADFVARRREWERRERDQVATAAARAAAARAKEAG